MQIPIHVTDLTRSDFLEITRAANLDAGEGLRIDRGGDKLVVSVDTAWLKNFVRATTATGNT